MRASSLDCYPSDRAGRAEGREAFGRCSAYRSRAGGRWLRLRSHLRLHAPLEGGRATSSRSCCSCDARGSGREWGGW